jgi:hypothetical protein
MSWINTMSQPNGAELWPPNGASDQLPFAGGAGAGYPAGMAGGAGDGYRPGWWGSPAAASSFASPSGEAGTTNGMLAQIMSMLQQLAGSIGGTAASPYASSPYGASPYASAPQAAPPWGGPQPGTATFANATLSSTGDPHLALTGTEQSANGTTTAVNDHYDDMAAQGDLLSTRDFGDGFRVSTTATQPNASGVTYNASATATMDHGRERVTMGPGGAVSVTDDGNAVNLSAGQSITLAGGEVVSENTSGAVSIAEQNAQGQSLTTTFSNNGSGVDVNATASGDVTLGGALVRHATGGI